MSFQAYFSELYTSCTTPFTGCQSTYADRKSSFADRVRVLLQSRPVISYSLISTHRRVQKALFVTLLKHFKHDISIIWGCQMEKNSYEPRKVRKTRSFLYGVRKLAFAFLKSRSFASAVHNWVVRELPLVCPAWVQSNYLRGDNREA